MKINIKTHGVSNSALDLWWFYSAYKQSQNKHQNYQSGVEICIDSVTDTQSTDINIGWYESPTAIDSGDADDFDLIFVTCGQHHLEVCTETMYELIGTKPHCYFVTGSYLASDHPYHHKTVCAPMVLNAMAYYTRPFYPQYFDRRFPSSTRAPLIFINGQNRVNREYVIRKLKQKVPELPIINNFDSQLERLQTSFFETEHDQLFRDTLNSSIENFDYADLQNKSAYYDRSIEVGLDGSHGRVAPGYFILDLYYKHHCVIFPETTWLNDEVFITEKIIKCLVSKSIPWPIAGSNTHQLYNDLGYQTAWNLLPDYLKSFDNTKDHAQRSELQAESIRWSDANPSIWSSQKAQDIREQNYNNFFSNTHDRMGVEKLDELITSVQHRKTKLLNY